ncbi:hypothetical protein LZ554_007348 [Drepanopeziza brunnea f. sp. 'monogermtubi']|nr:hypothetical protein LZ554_007348 [Drepanopeziza brunnea f. sp. 'monogermtubi']
MALRGVFSAVAIFASITNAIPTVAFPLNSQIPPAARINVLFSYTFPTSTFSSTLPMTYTLSSGPDWLSLDSNSRTLSGTPSTEDVGTDVVTDVPIILMASDADGSVTLDATLVVSQNPAPSLSIPATQLEKDGEFSAPSTLLYHPSTPFNINLDPGTFTSNGSDATLAYYALSTNNTPMPAWIQFDGSTLAFSGQTPDYQSLILPPQTFGIQLIASDIEGFSGTSMFFEIEVGVHLFAFNPADTVVNVTVGGDFSFDGLSGNLELDGQVAKPTDIVSATAQIPSWIVFDNTTLALTGTVPPDATSVNITMLATNIYGDTADVIIRVVITDALFSKSIGDFNATIGSNFSYDLSTYLTNKADTALTAKIPPLKTWLYLDSETFTLAGEISSEAEPEIIDIELSARSKSTNKEESESFKLVLVVSNTTSTTNTTSTATRASSKNTSEGPAATASKTSEPTAVAASSSKRLSDNAILAISIPIGVVFCTLLLALCCYCHRRRKAKQGKEFGKIEKREISSPLESSRPSIVEVYYQPSPLIPVPPPRPLQLDMSAFGIPGSARPGAVIGPIDGADTAERGRRKLADNPLRRSKTMSNPRLSQLINGDSYNSGFGRRRSKSDNALSTSEDSWRYTQGSTQLDLRSSGTGSSRTQPLTRNYSNYSRKGHVRRSAMLIPAIQDPSHPARESYHHGQVTADTILNLRDSNFSDRQLDSFSAIQNQANFQESNEPLPSIESPIVQPVALKSAKRRSRVMSTIDRPRAIGHGRPGSVASIGGIMKRQSIGHGQDYAPPHNMRRDSRTWLTVATSLETDKRRSVASASSTTYEEPMRRTRATSPRKTIRQVTKSPSIHYYPSVLSESSGNSRLSRPVSRRVGSSPFFGGSSIRNSKKIAKNANDRRPSFRSSYADSPTVPEESMMDDLEARIMRGMREMSDETDRDSFGISYSLAREGTRQLNSYHQGQMERSRTGGSLMSAESRDSRFESAAELDNLDRDRSPELGRRGEEGERGDESEFEDYLPDGYSDGSWETQRSREGAGNVELSSGGEGAGPGRGPGRGNSKSTPNSPEVGRAARIVRGAGRRPVSVDARAATRVVTQRGEIDYTAYI